MMLDGGMKWVQSLGAGLFGSLRAQVKRGMRDLSRDNPTLRQSRYSIPRRLLGEHDNVWGARAMQLAQGAVCRHQHAPPHHRADAQQLDVHLRERRPEGRRNSPGQNVKHPLRPNAVARGVQIAGFVSDPAHGAARTAILRPAGHLAQVTTLELNFQTRGISGRGLVSGLRLGLKHLIRDLTK
jgi:hypothetical protein